jgi:predicted RNase H-like HicB family nuclease
MKYKVALHEDEDGFAVSVPGLPGCWSQGDSEQEALEIIEAAIREYLQVVDDLICDSMVREIEIAV